MHYRKSHFEIVSILFQKYNNFGFLWVESNVPIMRNNDIFSLAKSTRVNGFKAEEQGLEKWFGRMEKNILENGIIIYK